MKYPIGIQTFEQIIDNGFVYVDKTDMVYALATEGKTYFLSRPRRFGKSLLLSTLRAYFEGKKELFKGLKIDKLEKDWHVHRVFHFDFNGMNFDVPNALSMKIEGYLYDWEKEYDIVPEVDFNLASRFERILKEAYQQTGRGAVVLVDEYDKPLLDVLEKDPELMDKNRETLKAFYSVFKQSDAYLRFVFLTGVTKFSQVSVFSGFNQPLDISMAEKFEALCGITEEELHTQFAEPIREMAQAENCRIDGQEPRNPQSLLFRVQTKRCLPALCVPDGCHQVLASQRIQWIQPTTGHQYGRKVRGAVWHYRGGTAHAIR